MARVAEDPLTEGLRSRARASWRSQRTGSCARPRATPEAGAAAGLYERSDRTAGTSAIDAEPDRAWWRAAMTKKPQTVAPCGATASVSPAHRKTGPDPGLSCPGAGMPAGVHPSVGTSLIPHRRRRVARSAAFRGEPAHQPAAPAASTGHVTTKGRRAAVRSGPARIRDPMPAPDADRGARRGTDRRAG